MKRYSTVFLFLTTIVMLASCSGTPDCFRNDVFCAALVTSTQKLEDHGLTQSAWQGLGEAKSSGLADQIAYIESVDTRDYEKNISFFAEQGFDMIVTISPGMMDATLRSADFYPDSVFIGIDQPFEEGRPNLVPVTFAEDQMGFLAGVLAARLTKTGTVGAVCETSGFDSMWRYCEGFRAGAIFAEENLQVLVAYRENGDREKLFIDETWGYEQGRSLIRRGADVLFAAGGGTGQGALKAASEAGVFAIGSERDQRAALGEPGSGVVTSIYGNAGFEVQQVMRMLKAGTLNEPVLSRFGYVPLEENFSENLTWELDMLLKSLLEGKIKTNVTNKRP